MITISAISIQELKSRIDPDSSARAGGCRSTAEESNVIDGYFTFFTDCESSGNTYAQVIQFLGWETIVPREEVDPETPLVTILQTYPDILLLDVRVDCSCPAFAYWGHRYNLDLENGSIYKSDLYTKNKPDSRMSCKHLATVYNTFFY